MENKSNESIEDLDNYLLDTYLHVKELHVENSTHVLTREEFLKGLTGIYLYGSKDPEDTDWVVPPGNYSAIAKRLRIPRTTISRYIKNYFTELIELGFKIPNIKRKYQKRTK
tara:strand:- start:720 stop:1055 length:336 start_codon:yes stop_codon:yes gene_type:complete